MKNFQISGGQYESQSEIYVINNPEGQDETKNLKQMVSLSTPTTLFNDDFIEGCINGKYDKVIMKNYLGYIILHVTAVQIITEYDTSEWPNGHVDSSGNEYSNNVDITLSYVEFPSYYSNSGASGGYTGKDSTYTYSNQERTINVHVARFENKVYLSSYNIYVTTITDITNKIK